MSDKRKPTAGPAGKNKPPGTKTKGAVTGYGIPPMGGRIGGIGGYSYASGMPGTVGVYETVEVFGPSTNVIVPVTVGTLTTEVVRPMIPVYEVVEPVYISSRPVTPMAVEVYDPVYVSTPQGPVVPISFESPGYSRYARPQVVESVSIIAIIEDTTRPGLTGPRIHQPFDINMIPVESPVDYSRLIQCPHCGKRFDPAVAARHIAQCRDYYFNEAEKEAFRKSKKKPAPKK